MREEGIFATMQALSMKLITYKKGRTQGQRVILEDKREQMLKSHSLTAEKIWRPLTPDLLAQSWPL